MSGKTQVPNVMAVADAAAQRQLRALTFMSAAVHAQEQPLSLTEPESSVTARPPVTEAAAVTPPSTGGVWACIANAETGGVSAMGPTYWTVFGMVTDIIEDYGTPAQQAAVFGGYADFGTQLDIASRFAADHGFGGWGYLTRQKCGL